MGRSVPVIPLWAPAYRLKRTNRQVNARMLSRDMMSNEETIWHGRGGFFTFIADASNEKLPRDGGAPSLKLSKKESRWGQGQLNTKGKKKNCWKSQHVQYHSATFKTSYRRRNARRLSQTKHKRLRLRKEYKGTGSERSKIRERENYLVWETRTKIVWRKEKLRTVP